MTANYSSIIVPLDGSATAESAIPLAIAIAQRGGARVTLVHVHDGGVLAANAPMTDSAWEDARRAEMGDALRATAERLGRETELDVTAVTLRGSAATALVQHAIDHAADLIVMTTHGRSGFSHAWFGSVAERVIHAATTAVLIVRAGEHARTDVAEPLFRHILLPIDREPSGAEAMQRALTLGTDGQTTYTLLTVVSALPALPPPYPTIGIVAGDPDSKHRGAEAAGVLARIAGGAGITGAAADLRVVTHERAAPAILDVAAANTDLIVMPTHPRRPFSRALLGSVVDKVMRGSTVPLLILRATPAVDELRALAAR